MKKFLLDVFAKEDAQLRPLLAKLWRRYALRGLSASNNHAGLDRLYALPDPWDMSHAREQSRFAQTNTVIESLVGRVDSMLEVGSGEGHQSQYLARLCRQLDGIDVSQRAVERARQRLPQGRFEFGYLDQMPATFASAAPYDLVVACEVLGYMRDIGPAVQRMSTLGRHCLVTFFCPWARLVAPHVQDIAGVRRGWIFHEPYAWLWAYWPSPVHRPAA